MKLQGKIFVFGDNVNTDEIIAARYLNTSDPAELAKHCMEDLRPGFAKRKDLKGNLFVAGDNFGCGSSREHAPIAIKKSGIACVIARSFARIFLRNAINVGLPIIELNETASFQEGDLLEVDLGKGKVHNRSRKLTLEFHPYPDFLREIIEIGGWIHFAKSKMDPKTSDYLQDIAQFPYKIENISY